MSLKLVHSSQNFKNKRVFVLGLGVSGFAIAGFLVGRGAVVTSSDQKTEEELGDRAKTLKDLGVNVRAGDFATTLEGDFDLLVLSPGISPLHPIVADAVKRGIAITNEPEIAFSFLKKPVIGITGTSGKSTVTTLIGLMLKSSGFNTFVGGNLGTSLITAVEHESDYDFIVAELSSYQLEQIRSLVPRVAVFTTIGQDHLDRYGTMDKYVETKRRLLTLGNSETLVVLNHDSLYLNKFSESEEIKNKKMRVSWFTTREVLHEVGANYDEIARTFTVVYGEEVAEFDVSDMKMLGEHNIKNLMTAAIAALEVGATPDAIQKVIETFPGLPHRIEFIREIAGVRYYNDSKATNEIAVKQSMALFEDSSVIWLAGGKSKAIAYETLGKVAQRKCAHVIYFGEARDRFEKEIPLKKVKFKSVPTMEEAIRLAHSLAKPGQTVLLSPACASFDVYKSFEDRGDSFRRVVERL
ncbi:MAG: UDP-N-acetylmuramoyl-L-alanine--D-glutamate ligase [Xanthomonadaceae bacterium]|nr:UDP-N-acetylmuramoyl-L-alanine--D-glutamate ligase [Xanthomonadaceae bacterium]